MFPILHQHPHREVHLPQLMNSHWHIIITQTPWLTLGFTLVHGLDVFMTTCIHRYSITQSHFTALKKSFIVKKKKKKQESKQYISVLILFFQVGRGYIFGFACTCKAPHLKRIHRNPGFVVISLTQGCRWVGTGQMGVRAGRSFPQFVFLYILMLCEYITYSECK